MTEKEVFQALLDGKTVEKVYGFVENTLYKMIDNKLHGQYYPKSSFKIVRLKDIVDSDKQLKIYQEKKTIVIDGKTIEISEESYNELKRSLT